MANLSIPDLDDEIYERLRNRADRHGVSMEEEARQILTRAVETQETPARLGDLFVKVFGPANGVELDLTPREWSSPLDLD